MATNNLLISQYTTGSVITTQEAFVNKPWVVPELRQSIGQGVFMFDLINMMKHDNEFVPAKSWTVQEKNPPFRTMTIGVTVSGGAAAADYIDFNLAVGDVDTQFNYAPRAGQSFWVGSASHMVEFIIKTVTATGGTDGATIRAYQKNSSATDAITPADYIKAGQTFALSPAVNSVQGGAATTPTHVGHQEFTFYTQILKDALGWENAELAQEKWVTVQGGKLYNEDLARMDLDLDAAMEATLWFGETTSNAALTMTSAAGPTNTITGTQGIWSHLAARGYDLNFTDTTDFTIEHLYSIAEYGESVGLPSGEWMFSAGGKLDRRIEKSCKSYITNATGSLNEMFTPDAGGGYKDLNVGFKSIMIGRQKFNIVGNHIFNNPLLFGITAYGVNDAAAVFPMMDVTTKTGRVPNLSIKYLGLPGYTSRKRAFAPFKGVGGPDFIGGPAQLTSDVSQVHAITNFGVEFLEAWRGVRVINTSWTGTV